MTLPKALEKVDRRMDDITAHVLLDAEDFIRGLGATNEECAAFVELKRAQLAEARNRVHEVTRAAYWTGLDSPSVRVN